MNTEDYLLKKFGPLMSMGNLAEILERSPDGLRVGLYNDCELSKQLRPTMIRIGRRIYFRTLQLSKVLGLDPAEGGAAL